MTENTHDRAEEQDEDQKTLDMGDQGPSYSSSYNESRPGEIAENRRRSLREHESSDENMSGES